MHDKGFVKILIIFLVGIFLIFLGIKFVKLPAQADKAVVKTSGEQPKQAVTATAETSPAPPLQKNIHYSNDLGFEFDYPNEGFAAISDSEEEFSKRAKTEFRKNFTSYVGFAPPASILAVVVRKLGEDPAKIFTLAPVSIWVFENPEGLEVDKWYEKYWYYPFIWGDFSQDSQKDEWPKNIAIISGQTAKYSVLSYPEGNPKFIFLSWKDKMFLFRTIGSNPEIDVIMKSFRLL